MDQKIIFRELLSEIREKAVSQGRTISRKEVEDFFAHAALTGDQIDLICAYLEEQHIEVTGDAKRGTELGHASGFGLHQEADEADGSKTRGTGSAPEAAPDQDEESGLERFLREIEQIRAPEASRELELFHAVARKDADARQQLSSLYLQTVCSLAAEYEQEGLPAEDLVQEGSVGLLLALDGLEKMDSLAAYRTRLFNEINQYLEQVIRDHQEENDAGGAALRKVQRLDDAMQSLMEDFGRKVTVEEVSAFLEMPAEEVRDIARLAGNELEFADQAAPEKMPWEL